MHVNRLIRQAKVAAKYDILPSTLSQAIKRGEIATYETVCGLPLVKESDVAEWQADETRKPGPKKAPEK